MDRLTHASGMAFAIAAIFNMLLVLAKERLPGVLDWMNAFTGHHWMTHSLLVMAVFLASGALLMFRKTGSASGLTVATVGATVVSSAIIAGYYLFR